MGEGGILLEPPQHLMHTAAEAEMDRHLAVGAGQRGGRGSRSAKNMPNGYRTKKVMTEVGTVTVAGPPGTGWAPSAPRLLPKYARRTGASEGRLVITPSQWNRRVSE
ncbi:transposase [Streptomyces mirabilis]|uniref:transposase n=1 Tax=Streptomyces mirabilis TaxID=68239 RepID=UPI0036B353EF